MKTFKSLLALFVAIGCIACSDNSDDADSDENFDYKIANCEILTLTSEFSGEGSSWSVSRSPSENYSLVTTHTNEVLFAAVAPGMYELSVSTASSGVKVLKVYVEDASKGYKSYIHKVYDFRPAPGQFINDLPKVSAGDTYESVLQKTNNCLAKEKGDMISLGGFGGYVVFGFDHTVVNVKGKRDFRVLGNAFRSNANPNPTAFTQGGSSESGIIRVAYDKNKNGRPDEDEWYEIKGAAHDLAETVFDYELTYHWPNPDKTPVPGNASGSVWFPDVEYIKWEDNQGANGYLWQNSSSSHSLAYWPQWLENEKTMTFKGTRLPDNGVDESGDGTYYVQYAFDYGYADNVPNSDDESAIDIAWAIDKDGNSVDLPGIDFVKIYNGLHQQCGWLGETSTEVMGANDLHLRGEDIPTRQVN